MYNLTYEKTDQGYIISGQTFRCKDDIRSCGGKWQPDKKTWLIDDIKELQERISMLKTLNNLQLAKFKDMRQKKSVY